MTDYPILLEDGSGYWLFEDGSRMVWRYSGDTAWSFVVDWDNNGVFDDGDEANRVIEVSVDRGREYKFAADGRGFKYPKVGKANIVLDNYDGRYDPNNTDGALYGNLLPGRRFKLVAHDNINGVSYDTIHGSLEDIQPMSGHNKYAAIKCQGDLARLRDYDYDADLYTDQDADDLILQILTDIGWVADGIGYSIDSSPLDVVSYWWCTDKTALKAVEELCDSFLGKFFVARDGTFKFYNRQHSYESAMTLSQTQLRKDIKVMQPWETVKNYIRVRSYPRILSGVTETLWTLYDTPYIEAGVTIEFWAENLYESEVVPANFAALTKTTDYTANAQADGLGADMTDDLTVVDTQFATTRKIAVTNDHVANTAYLTLLQSRGCPITSRPTTVIKENTTSQSIYGKKKFILDSEWLQDSNKANDLAVYLNTAYRVPELYPEVIIEGRPDIQFGIDLFDQETLDISELGITGDYLVISIKHHWMAGRGAQTTIRFEPAYDYASNYWVFTTEIGVSSILGF